MHDLLQPHHMEVTVRNTRSDDIPKIVDLQKESFPYLARYGNIWHPEELESHLRIFPQGPFVTVESDGIVMGSASTLIISLNPEYADILGKRLLLMAHLQITIPQSYWR